MAEYCTTCKTEVALNFCPACGRPKEVKRIDRQYMLEEVRVALSFEKGFLHTIRELILNPGQSIREFIQEDRSKLVRPIVFLIISSLVYAIFNNIFHVEEEYVEFSGPKESAIFAIRQWIQANYSYSNLLMAVFIGFFLKGLFKKYQFNYFEILILLCFVMGMGMLIFAVFVLVQGWTHMQVMPVAAVAGFIYMTYAIGQFFDKRKPISYFKAFIAYMIGLITFSVATVVVGVIIDLIWKGSI